MAVVSAPLPAPAPSIDVCTRCQFVWFDAREYEALPALPAVPGPDDDLPPAARQALALMELKVIRDRAERDNLGAQGPDEWWQWIPALLGMPVEADAPAVARLPWVTWGVALAVTLASAYAFVVNPEAAIDAWGLVPAAWWRDGGLTLVTSFFIHGGVLHLVGNMYFLLLFGDNVEEVLGRWRFALLLLAATLAGHAVHILGEPRSALPCVGASGGIAGVLAYYALRFPHARIGILWRFYFLFRWVRLPAYAMFLMWLALQFMGVWAQVRGFSHVSALAHLGGAAAGGLAWVLTRRRGEAGCADGASQVSSRPR